MSDNTYKALQKILTRHSARFECIVDYLVENKLFKLDDISIVTASNFKRGFINDISSIKIERDDEIQSASAYTLQLEISREGIYDMLPKSLFHQFDYASATIGSIDDENYSANPFEEEYRAARQFFSPLEQEFYRKRIELEIQERKNHSGFTSPLQFYVLESIWPKTKSLPDDLKVHLTYLVPLAHKIAGNIEWITLVLKVLLSENVAVELVKGESVSYTEDLVSRLGINSGLGFDFIPGPEMQDDLPHIDIRIGPVDLTDLPLYLNGGYKEILINLVCDNFVPYEASVALSVDVVASGPSYTIDQKIETARLGYSTLL